MGGCAAAAVRRGLERVSPGQAEAAHEGDGESDVLTGKDAEDVVEASSVENELMDGELSLVGFDFEPAGGCSLDEELLFGLGVGVYPSEGSGLGGGEDLLGGPCLEVSRGKDGDGDLVEAGIFAGGIDAGLD